MLFRVERIHFVGIGGAGMCPMAEVMVKKGHQVSGSDLQRTSATEYLESLGVNIQYNHVPDLAKDTRLLVYSSAVKSDNEELVYARNHGITCMKRAEMLGDLMRAKLSIGVAGTHGKTTTTSLIGNIFCDAGKDPTVIVGGMFRDKESNAIVGNGNMLIAEADEYDRSFLRMFPSVAVVTNIEADHLDIYKDLANIIDAFVEYINKIPFYGMAVLCEDDLVTNRIYDRIDKTIITYGTSEKADYRADAIRLGKGNSEFDVVKDGSILGTIDIPLAGLHNVRNTLAAIAVSHEMKVSFDIIKKSLKNFMGIKRRFEVIGIERDITVIDDYAHHPTEINATLITAKNAGFKRIVAVFQPHLYSRTRDFLDEFAKSLINADIAVVTGIYKAREEPVKGVSSVSIIEKMREMGYDNALYVETIDELAAVLTPVLKSGDGVVLMGAGDIWKVGAALLKRIKHG